MEKRKHGKAQPGKGTSVPCRSSHTQTEADTSNSELQSMSQQLAARDCELDALRAELQSITQALEKDPAPNSDLKDAQEAMLIHAEVINSAHVLDEQTVAQQVEQSQADLAASQEQCRQLLQRLQDSEQQLAHTPEQPVASPPGSQPPPQPELQQLTHQLEEAQAEVLRLGHAQESLTQQLREAHLHNSELGQTQSSWCSLALHSSQLTFTTLADREAAEAAAQPVQTMQHVVKVLHDRAEEAQTAVKELTHQLQAAVAAHAHETEHLRYEVACAEHPVHCTQMGVPSRSQANPVEVANCGPPAGRPACNAVVLCTEISLSSASETNTRASLQHQLTTCKAISL